MRRLTMCVREVHCSRLQRFDRLESDGKEEQNVRDTRKQTSRMLGFTVEPMSILWLFFLFVPSDGYGKLEGQCRG